MNSTIKEAWGDRTDWRYTIIYIYVYIYILEICLYYDIKTVL
jgi:hypothetical protein